MLREKINEATKEALKAGDKLKLSTVFGGKQSVFEKQ